MNVTSAGAGDLRSATQAVSHAYVTPNRKTLDTEARLSFPGWQYFVRRPSSLQGEPLAVCLPPLGEDNSGLLPGLCWTLACGLALCWFSSVSCHCNKLEARVA